MNLTHEAGADDGGLEFFHKKLILSVDTKYGAW